MKKLEIFKPGTHVAMSGASISFTEADLRASASAYDPAKHEAPLVIGHPAVDAPAYGWAKSMNFADGVATVEPDQVDTAFAELVNRGAFKKISASFYLPDAPNNPVPGVYYLRHVGFLGAQAPAVKGLKSASFSDAEAGVVSFGDTEDQVELGFWRRLKNWMIGKEGVDAAEAMLPEYELGILAQEAYSPEECLPATTQYSESNKEDEMNKEELAAQKATLDKQAADFAEREKGLKAKETIARHSEHVSFADGLVREGKLLPALKEQAVAMLDFSAALESDNVVEFGEGGGKKCQPLAESFREFLSSQPRIVDFGEHAKSVDKDTNVVNFSAPPGFSVDPAGLELHHKAQAYQQKNPGVDYIAAVKVCQ